MRDSSLLPSDSPAFLARFRKGGPLLLALLLLACGDDASSGEDPDTETEGEGADPSAGPGSSTGIEPDTGDGSTGDTNDPDMDTDDTDTGDEEATDLRHRIVFSVIGPAGPAGITSYRLYSATSDFVDVEDLTPTSPYPIDLEQARPSLHADNRHVAFVLDRTIYVADVWTGETVAEWFATDSVVRTRWSPVETVLLWTREDDQLSRGSPGSDAEIIFDLTGDNTPIKQIFFDWNPLGDRLVLSSRPDGAGANKVWVMNADGSEPGLVANPIAGVNSFFAWTAAGDRLVVSGNIVADYPGDEIVVGERDGYEMISHPSGNVSRVALSGDRTRVLYLAGQGLFSVDVDGTGSTLIDAPASPNAHSWLVINDAGTWAARSDDGALRVTPTTLHAPTVIAESGVDGRSVMFEPGGARLAYLRANEPDGPTTLWRVDGNGTAEVSHALPEGRFVPRYDWAGGGLRYIVAETGGRVEGIHHTAGGEVPMFVPDPDEDELDWVESDDGALLVVRTGRFGGSGRLCSFDVSDPASWLALGCREYIGEDIFVAVATDPEAP
jgi:hypothetical protein